MFSYAIRFLPYNWRKKNDEDLLYAPDLMFSQALRYSYNQQYVCSVPINKIPTHFIINYVSIKAKTQAIFTVSVEIIFSS